MDGISKGTSPESGLPADAMTECAAAQGRSSELAWLLGSVTGPTAEVEAIHGARLERFLERLVETPVRRFV